jgi:hypothetical protein
MFFKKPNMYIRGMYRTELSYFIILTVIILFSEFLPTSVLLLLDNFIIRIVIVLVLLYLVSIGPTAGIIGLMTIAVIYLERNKRKVVVATKKLDKMDWNRPNQATIEEASKPQKTVPVNEFNEPDKEESYFFPDETCESDNFEPVAPTINEKAVLASIYPLNKSGPEAGDGSNELFEKLGFGHIPGVITMGDTDNY